MKKYLLPETGNFYKANMHMHTTVSDGSYTPEEVKKLYQAHGYSIVAYTDHEIMVPHNDLADDDFLPITSYEFAVNKQNTPGYAFMPCYHINFYAKDKNEKHMPIFVEQRILEKSKKYITAEMRAAQNTDFTYSVECLNDLIKKGNEMGFLVSYNHPYWSLQNYNDYVGLEGVWGVEFTNYGCLVEGYHLDCDIRPIEDMLRAGKRVFPLATDDAHILSHCFGGYIMIKADKLEYKTIMDALERGDFYASTGPEIKELTIENGIVHVSCSEAARISLTTELRFARCKNADGDNLCTEADFDLSKYIEIVKNATNSPWDSYFRVTVTDKNGNLAHSRAYFLDELQ